MRKFEVTITKISDEFEIEAKNVEEAKIEALSMIDYNVWEMVVSEVL